MIQHLPFELFFLLFSLLEIKDYKSLFLTCKQFNKFQKKKPYKKFFNKTKFNCKLNSIQKTKWREIKESVFTNLIGKYEKLLYVKDRPHYLETEFLRNPQSHSFHIDCENDSVISSGNWIEQLEFQEPVEQIYMIIQNQETYVQDRILYQPEDKKEILLYSNNNQKLDVFKIRLCWLNWCTNVSFRVHPPQKFKCLLYQLIDQNFTRKTLKYGYFKIEERILFFVGLKIFHIPEKEEIVKQALKEGKKIDEFNIIFDVLPRTVLY